MQNGGLSTHHTQIFSFLLKSLSFSRMDVSGFAFASLSILDWYIYWIMMLFAGSLPLPWSIRMKIALGAAKGLAFLHEEAERPVIYRDFKTSNILLDAVCNRTFTKLCI